MNLAGKNIKCIAFDLDHTVINSDGTMSDATRTVIEQAIAEGIEIVPVSGRAFATFPESIGQIKGISYAVTSNGAAIYNKKTGERIHGVAIEYADLHSILDAFAHYFHNGQITYEAFVDGVAYGGREYVEHPEAFGVPERHMCSPHENRWMTSLRFSQSMKKNWTVWILWLRIQRYIKKLKNRFPSLPNRYTRHRRYPIVWRSHIKIPEKQLV